MKSTHLKKTGPRSNRKDDEIREYARRHWTESSGFDRAYWAAEYQRSGFIAAQKVSLALWQHMKSIRNGWPEERDRQQDLDNHIALKRLLDRSADAITTGCPVQQS